MSEPTVELVDGCFYWIKRAYTDPETWTVATWGHGSWWDVNGKETTPRVISGPIPRPAENAPVGSEQRDEGNLPPDEPENPLRTKGGGA